MKEMKETEIIEKLKSLLIQERFLAQERCDHPYRSVMGEEDYAYCLACGYKFGLNKEENKQLLVEELMAEISKQEGGPHEQGT